MLLTFTERNATTNAATSDNMWKLSAIRAIEFVTYPTIISTRKKNAVNHNMVKRRHFFPVNRPILIICKWNKNK